MASDYRIRLVLNEDEHLACGKCGELKGDGDSVFVGDPNDVVNTVLCDPCYQKEA